MTARESRNRVLGTLPAFALFLLILWKQFCASPPPEPLSSVGFRRGPDADGGTYVGRAATFFGYDVLHPGARVGDMCIVGAHKDQPQTLSVDCAVSQDDWVRLRTITTGPAHEVYIDVKDYPVHLVPK